MATTNFTLQDRIREFIDDALQDTNNDAVADDGRSLLSDERLEEFIIQCCPDVEQSYVFQRSGNSNYYKYYYSNRKHHFFDASFTEEGGIDYEFHSSGYIKVVSGTPTLSTITVTATLVDIGLIVYEILMYLATRYAQKSNFQIIDGAVQYDNTYKNLVSQAHLFRGIYSV